jgi:diguanylate cyclase (GGDEF)-like protein
MSFSNRLTTFFVLMVLIPILAIGVLGFRLIDQTTSGRAGARASGLITAGSGVYTADEKAARSDAQAIAQSVARLSDADIRARLAKAAAGAGLVRVLIQRDHRTIASYGSKNAVAPGTVNIRSGTTTTTVTASITTAGQFVQAISGPLSASIVSQDGRVLASNLGAKLPAKLPTQSNVTIAGSTYASDSYASLAGFGTEPVTLTALSDMRASTGSTSSSEVIAIAFLGGFALLSFGFAVLASRGLNEMVKRFLAAATRLADLDFSVRVPVEGKDEFARLATEFNRMSDQLEAYIAALDDERQRLRDSIRRTGETFASSHNREQLETITLETAMSAIDGDFGRMTWRDDEDSPLGVARTAGEWREAGDLILDAEQTALNETAAAFGESQGADTYVMAARMGTTPQRSLAYGTLTVGRRNQPFDDDDKALFRSLAAQASRALDNVRLHLEADRKATTDLLTGLANHGKFQQTLSHEMEDARRYQYPVGLILFDLDNFKRVNDTYGHLQGDAVLRGVARVLAQSTREGDTAARYGGEEMALILPHTDLEGSYAIAERVRSEIEDMAIAMVDGSGELRVTASIGVSAAVDGEKDDLIAEADAALYTAKRTGKNRVVRAAHASAS